MGCDDQALALTAWEGSALSVAMATNNTQLYASTRQPSPGPYQRGKSYHAISSSDDGLTGAVGGARLRPHCVNIIKYFHNPHDMGLTISRPTQDDDRVFSSK